MTAQSETERGTQTRVEQRVHHEESEFQLLQMEEKDEENHHDGEAQTAINLFAISEVAFFLSTSQDGDTFW